MPHRPTPPTATAPSGSASKLLLRHFIVLCLAMGAVLHVKSLIDVAAKLQLHPGIIACFVFAVTALFNWASLSLNFHIARRAAESEPKMLLRPAAPANSASRSPHVARLALLAVAALVSASWFVQTFTAIAELWLSKAIIIVFVLLFAALFNVSTHLFRSFLACSPSAGAAAGQGQGVGSITAGVMAIAIAIANRGRWIHSFMCSRQLVTES